VPGYWNCLKQSINRLSALQRIVPKALDELP
jgi:hypothetical protein